VGKAVDVGELKARAAAVRRSLVDPVIAPWQTAGTTALFQVRLDRAANRLAEAAAYQHLATGSLPAEPLIRELVGQWHAVGFDDAFEQARVFEERAFAGSVEDEWRARVEAEFGFVDIRGMQTGAALRVPLDRLWVGLRAEREPEDESREPHLAWVRSRSRGDEQFIPVTAIARENPVVAFVAGPGSGKSTLVARLAVDAARNANGPVPFVVPGHRWQGDAVTAVTLANAAGYNAAQTALLVDCWNSGRALVIVDAVDECSSPSTLVAALDAAAAALGGTGNRLVVTSRPLPAWATTKRLRKHTWTLAAFERSEQEAYVDQWTQAVEIALHNVPDPKAQQAERPLKLAANAATKLKRALRANRALGELAGTPLLILCMCALHRFMGERLPERRVALYEAVVNLLLFEWDKSKLASDALLGQLDREQRCGLMAHLALAMLDGGAREWQDAEILAALEHAQVAKDQRWGQAELLTALGEVRNRGGLLVEAAPGRWRFVHLALQEYLAARALAELWDLGAILARWRKAPERWREVVVLYAGLPGVDAGTLVDAVSEEAHNQPRLESSQFSRYKLAAECIGSAALPPPGRIGSLYDASVARLTILGAAHVMRVGGIAEFAQLRFASALDAAIERGQAAEIEDALFALSELGASGGVGAIAARLPKLAQPEFRPAHTPITAADPKGGSELGLFASALLVASYASGRWPGDAETRNVATVAAAVAQHPDLRRPLEDHWQRIRGGVARLDPHSAAEYGGFLESVLRQSGDDGDRERLDRLVAGLPTTAAVGNARPEKPPAAASTPATPGRSRR